MELVQLPETPIDKRNPCPQCLAEGRGVVRIGTRNMVCGTCNRFTSRVRSATTARFRETMPETYYRLRMDVEADLYARMLDEYNRMAGIPDDLTIDPLDVPVLRPDGGV